jgi:hypothetical protein
MLYVLTHIEISEDCNLGTSKCALQHEDGRARVCVENAFRQGMSGK